MQAVLITLHAGTFSETPLGKLYPSSVAKVISALSKYASRHFGKEGHDWRIVQTKDTRIVPFYVKGLASNQESEIHCL